MRLIYAVPNVVDQERKKPSPGELGYGFFLARDPPNEPYRRTPTRLTPPFKLPPAL